MGELSSNLVRNLGDNIGVIFALKCDKQRLNYECSGSQTVDTFEPNEKMSVVAASYDNNTDEYVIEYGPGLLLVYWTKPRNRLAVTTAAPTAEEAQQMARDFMADYPEMVVDLDTRIAIAVWAFSTNGGVRYDRTVDAEGFDDIKGNYTKRVSDELTKLRDWTPPTDANGKLILWHGSPGTGKTWAIRMLAKEWQSWAELHFVSDPEQFFGGSPTYLFQVAMGEDNKPSYLNGDEEDTAANKWRIIVLEDSGELLGKDAKAQVGQGLSRFLNLTDGLLGQGLRTLVLVTTNEEVGELHEAVRRPGRCLASVAFDPLTSAEAKVWLKARGFDEPWAPTDTRLSNLYDLVNKQQLVKEKEHKVIGFQK